MSKELLHPQGEPSFGELQLNIRYLSGNNDKEQNVLEKYGHLLDYLDSQAQNQPAKYASIFASVIEATRNQALLTAAIFDKLAE